MSEVNIGCFGKPSFSLMRELQGLLSVSRSPWNDAHPISADSDLVMSIDSVEFAQEDWSNSCVLALLHSMNDVFAADAYPLTVSISFMLTGQPKRPEMEGLSEALVNFANISGITIGKLHTSFDCEKSNVTIAVVGKTHKEGRLANFETGSVYLLDSLRLPQQVISLINDRWVLDRLESRRWCVSRIPGAKKDVSGDGLAGAMVQMAIKHDYEVHLNASALAKSIIYAPLDSCHQDRNYADYADMLSGFDKVNNSKVRAALFEPQFAGPIVCFTRDNLIDDEIDRPVEAVITRIGTFKRGTPGVSIK
jgi:hypothetical protein